MEPGSAVELLPLMLRLMLWKPSRFFDSWVPRGLVPWVGFGAKPRDISFVRRMFLLKNFLRSLSVLLILTALSAPSAHVAEGFRVGTWKTAQTIAPFFYPDHLEGGAEVPVVIPRPRDRFDGALVRLCREVRDFLVSEAAAGDCGVGKGVEGP